MCSSAYYVAEFSRLLQPGGALYSPDIVAAVDRLRDCPLRSLVWRLYLHVLPCRGISGVSEQLGGWVQLSRQLRHGYSHLKHAFMDRTDVTSDVLHSAINNPLSQHEQNPWLRVFEHEQLRNILRVDVIRAVPDHSFFNDASIRAMMVDILFVFVLKHPEFSYIQGMHEILAPVVYLLHSEYHRLSERTAGLPTGSSHDRMVMRSLYNLFDTDFIEHDAFCILEKILLMMDFSELSPKCTIISSKVQEGEKCFWQLTSCNEAYVSLLPRFDKPLFRRLNVLQVEPQLYGLRMFRVLFGREFSLKDLPLVWDALFAQCFRTISLSLVPAMFIAVLISHRKRLMMASDSEALRILMRLPPISDVRQFIQLTLHIDQPKIYSCPMRYRGDICRRIFSPLLSGLNKMHRNMRTTKPQTKSVARSSRVQPDVVGQLLQSVSPPDRTDSSPEPTADCVLMYDVHALRQRHSLIASADWGISPSMCKLTADRWLVRRHDESKQQMSPICHQVSENSEPCLPVSLSSLSTCQQVELNSSSDDMTSEIDQKSPAFPELPN